MGQDTLVTETFDNGRKLIDSLITEGFDIDLAFWAKDSEIGEWFLYLSSPFVDQHGPLAAYRLVHEVARRMPELGIVPLDFKVVGVRDTKSVDARKLCRTTATTVSNPKISTRMTRVGSATLAGMSIDGAYFYPPPQPVAST